MFEYWKQRLKTRLSAQGRVRLLRVYGWLLRLTYPGRVWRLRRRHVGAGSYIARSVHALGWGNIRIGANTVVCEGTCINVNNRGGVEPSISIGDYCFIGRQNFLTNGYKICIKNYCMTGTDCRFLSGDHSIEDPFIPHIATTVPARNSIILGVNTRLGANVTILGDVSIGHGSTIGAGALVTRSALPFSLMVGNPARVIKRFDMGSSTWVPVEQFTADMEAMLPDECTYLKLLEERKPSILMPIDAAGKCRGDLP